MYQNHPFFEYPQNDARIWRYMDLEKFFWLLEHSALYFCRLDRLPDRFEGAWSKPTFKAITADYEDFAKRHGVTEEAVQRVLRDTNYFHFATWAQFAVNCWTINEHESATMWQSYVKSGMGVAVESSSERLAACLNGSPDWLIHIGKVRYADYATEEFPLPNSPDRALFPCLYKRLFFRDERELRIVVRKPLEPRVGRDGRRLWHAQPLSDHVQIPVRLGTLIARVVVAPGAELEVFQRIDSAMRDAGFCGGPSRSSLDEDPFTPQERR